MEVTDGTQTQAVEQLRNLWLTNRDTNTRQVIEEVVCHRREAEQREPLLVDLERLYVAIHQSWREAVGDKLIALECMKSRFSNLCLLRGELPGIPGAPPR
ncbi:hypothetical protein [Pandoraea pulmonicola]|uniref:Uncharacterized protein n=1 Tax=Pandoraea pulmonicola TaxID=93221 RepID=A0AAJ5D2S0_PANPU|nr:hypothetical protein [Pandoraea pulmonicola]AJC22644.1 hypothetical protein RO07_23195 [Pandoraea pulmonicola]SUA93128.1 Uncharacterised protein [Pandoraea pulmonicola]